MTGALELLALAALALAGGWLGWRLHLPGGPILGSLLVVTPVLLATGLSAEPPEPLQLAAFVIIGWLVGEGFDRDTRGSLIRGLVPITIAVAALTIIVAGLVWLLQALTPLEPIAALLVAPPGGLSQMVALSLSVDADPVVVATLQFARVLVVVVTVPLVLRAINGHATPER